MSDQATMPPSDTRLARIGHWIDGASVVPEGGEWLDQVSPMTGRPSLSVAAGTAADVDRAVGAARAA